MKKNDEIKLNVAQSTACLSRRGFLRNAALFGAGLGMLGVAGCASDGGGSGSAAAEDEQTSGGVLSLSQSSAPRYLDPVKYTGSYESQIICLVCDTLVEYKMDLSEIGPNLATDWTVSDDGLTYTFNLRDDVVFQPGQIQDGRAMTADDVKFSLERSAAQSALKRLDMLDHCNVISDTQVECVLKYPAASFITALTDSGNVIIPRDECEGLGDDFGNNLVGTGPFKLKEFVLDQQAEVERNDTYWGPTPYLDGVIVRTISDMNQAVNALATGELNIATSLTGEAINNVKNNSDLVLNQSEGLHIAFVAFNQVEGPTADQRVRKALIMALDREELCKGAYPYGEATVASVPLPRGSWGYDEAVEELVPQYDPEAAKELLAEAGYPDGLTLTLYISNTDARQRMATIVKQSLKDNLNVDVDIHISDWGTFSEAAAAGTPDMYGVSWSWYPDPWFFLNQLFSTDMLGSMGNGMHFSHEEVDDLLAQANAATDQDERAKYYSDALKAIVSYDPVIVYASELVNTGLTKDVQGYVQRADNKAIICNSEVNISLAQ